MSSGCLPHDKFREIPLSVLHGPRLGRKIQRRASSRERGDRLSNRPNLSMEVTYPLFDERRKGSEYNSISWEVSFFFSNYEGIGAGCVDRPWTNIG